MTLKALYIGAALALAAPASAAGQHDHSAMMDTSVVTKPLAMSRLPNAPGKSLKTIAVSYAPGAKSPPHRHAASAFVYAQVLEGAIRSQVDGHEIRTYQVGESWTESPGDHHLISENASMTDPAKLLVVFIVDTADGQLTAPDK